MKIKETTMITGELCMDQREVCIGTNFCKAPLNGLLIVFAYLLFSLSTTTSLKAQGIAYFNDPVYGAFEDDGSCFDEVSNVSFVLSDLGYSVDQINSIHNFTGSLLNKDVLVIPGQEAYLATNFVNDINNTNKSAIQEFTSNGGTTILMHNALLMNSLFDYEIYHATGAIGAISSTPSVTGTCFEKTSILPDLEATDLLVTTLPPGAICFYKDATDYSPVVSLPYGSGVIFFLGWDWYDGGDGCPQYSADWNTVLDCAIAAGLSEPKAIDCVICPEDREEAIDNPIDCDLEVSFELPEIAEEIVNFTEAYDPANWITTSDFTGSVDFSAGNTILTLVGSDIMNMGPDESSDIVTICLEVPCSGTLNFKYGASTSGIAGTFENDMAGYILNGIEEDLTDPLSVTMAAGPPPIDVNGGDEFCFFVKSNHFSEYTSFTVQTFSFEPVYTSICAPAVIPKFGTEEPDAQPTLDMGVVSSIMLSPGEYTVQWQFKDKYAREQFICEEDIEIDAFDPGGISCQPFNLSLNQFCSAELTPAMVVTTDEPGCWDNYSIYIEDEYGNHIDNPVGLDHVGKTLTYKVCIPSLNLCCWNTVTIEDYLPPVIDCGMDVVIPCNQMGMIPHPTVVNDFCDDIELVLLDSVVNQLDCEPYKAEILKTWTAYDKAGNKGNICVQRILVERPMIVMTTPPDPLPKVECNQFMEDANGSPHPLETKVPMLNGYPLWPNVPASLCQTSVTYKDYPATEGTCNRVIRRVWDIYEWHCFGEEHMQFVQMITISDKTAPHMEVPDDFTVSAGPDCGKNIYIPFAYAHDDCAGLKFIHLNSDLDYAADGGKTGAYLDLELGDNIVEYIAIDSCHNEVTDTVIVTVLDLREPVAICDAHPVISLTAGGTAILTAEKIDGGSFDECGPVWLEIAKMNETCEPADTVFGPFVNLCCEDVGTINVILRVTDLYNNQSMCMMPIVIADLYLPEILEPNDITVTCTTPYDLDNLGIQFGEAQQISGCVDTLVERVVEDINDCGEGDITRTFVAYNSKGDSSTKKQVIYFENKHKFDGDKDIDWLSDTILYLSPTNDLCLMGKDTSNTESFILPTSKDSLGITKDNCDLIGVTFKDSLFRDGAKLNACYTIRRHWKVVDWCQKPNGEYLTWEDTQTIRVEDRIKPVIDTSYVKGAVSPMDPLDPDTVFVKACDPQQIEARAVGTTNCDTMLLWSWVLHDQYNLPIDESAMPFEVAVSDTASAVLDKIDVLVVDREYTIVWTAHDGCGNIETMSNTFYLKNKKVAVPYAKSIAVQIQPVNNFPDSFSVSVHIDQLDNGSYHECLGIGIDLSFSPDPNDDIRVYDCSQAGTVVVDTLYVTDELGNQNYVTSTISVGVGVPVVMLSHPHTVDGSVMNAAIDIDDAVVSIDTVCTGLVDIGFGEGFDDSLPVDCTNGNGAASAYIYYQDAYNPLDSIKFDYQIIGCTTISPRISGEVLSINDAPMEDVMVHLLGSEAAPDFTDNVGAFAFPDMPMGGSYDVQPTHDHDPLNGVSTLDLVMIQRHVLGVTTLTDPYQLIAADVNNNEDVSAIDLIELRKLILGVYTDFPSNVSWRFLDADYVFPNPKDPWLQALPEGYSINTLLTDMHIPFVGVKTGDVNGSAIMNYNGSNVSSRSQAKTVVLEQLDAQTITVSFDETEAISGWQLALNMDESLIQKVVVVAGDFNVQAHNWHKHTDLGAMIFSWHSRTVSDADQKVMFQLYAESGINVNDITLNESIINAEAYTDALERKPLTLEARSSILEETTLSLYPNPWIHETRVEYNLNIDQEVELIITDAAGRVILKENINSAKGKNVHTITEDQLSDAGVYFIKLVSNDGQKDLRMIKIE